MAATKIDPFNPTEEQTTAFIQQYGDENGFIEEDIYADFLSGNLEIDLEAERDTADATDDDRDASSEEASQASLEEDDGDVAAAADAGDDAEDQDDDEPDEEPEPKVLAKDGENTIPYSVLEDLRNEVKSLKDSNAELKQMLDKDPEIEEKIEEAAEQGQDPHELLAELEEDYPGISDKLSKIFLAPVQNKLEQIDSLVADKAARDEQTAKDAAQAEYNEAANKLDDRYEATLHNDTFWKWFDKQPAIIKQAERSGDPQHFVDAMGMFYAAHPDEDPRAETDEARGASSQAPAPRRKVEPQEIKDKVKAAKAKADEKPSVDSLSDLPGGNNPEHDEVEAFMNLSQIDKANKVLAMSPEQREALLSRLS